MSAAADYFRQLMLFCRRFIYAPPTSVFAADASRDAPPLFLMLLR